jgi:hypothetical protein
MTKHTIRFTEAERRLAKMLTVKLRLSQAATTAFGSIQLPGETPTGTLRRLITAEIARKTKGRKKSTSPIK